MSTFVDETLPGPKPGSVFYYFTKSLVLLLKFYWVGCVFVSG